MDIDGGKKNIDKKTRPPLSTQMDRLFYDLKIFQCMCMAHIIYKIYRCGTDSLTRNDEPYYFVTTTHYYHHNYKCSKEIRCVIIMIKNQMTYTQLMNKLINFTLNSAQNCNRETDSPKKNIEKTSTHFRHTVLLRHHAHIAFLHIQKSSSKC